MCFPHLEARWGESVPEVCLCLRDFACRLSPQWHVKLCSPKKRVQEAVGRGRRRIQKVGNAEKYMSFGTLKLDFRDLKSLSHLKEK